MITPELPDLLRHVVQASLAANYTCRPAKVVAYDSAAQTVNVKVALEESIEGPNGLVDKILPEIDKVPIGWPRLGSWLLTMPITAGDWILLIFADRSIDDWIGDGRVGTPKHARRHHLTDALALPICPYPDSNVLSETDIDTKMTIGRQGGMCIQIDTSGNIALTSVGGTTQPAALADDVKTELDAIRSDIDDLKAVFAGWSPTANDGGAALRIAAGTWYGSTLGVAGSVGSTKVEIEE